MASWSVERVRTLQPVTLRGRLGCAPVAAHADQYRSEPAPAASRIRIAGCVRVEFKTDRLNEKSRAALRRIGAVEEGMSLSLRNRRSGAVVSVKM